MDNNTQEQQGSVAPQQPTSTKKWIIIAVVVVVLLYVVQMIFSTFLSPESIVERAIERESGANVNIENGSVTVTGENGERIEINTDGDGTVNMRGENGESFSVSGGEDLAIPDAWPTSVPIYDGARVLSSGVGTVVTGETGGAMLTYTVSTSASDVVSYYKDSLTSAGWTINGVFESADSSMISATRNNEEESVSVIVGSSDGETTVSLTTNAGN